MQPVAQADELTVFRRVSLALFGCVPALAEIKAFEQDLQPDRLDRWIVRMLRDERFGRYFADRLARSLTGVEQGPLFIFAVTVCVTGWRNRCWPTLPGPG